jgi:hypothetical protein
VVTPIGHGSNFEGHAPAGRADSGCDGTGRTAGAHLGYTTCWLCCPVLRSARPVRRLYV